MAVLSACATRVAAPQMEAYRDCVRSQAMDMLDEPGTPHEIARLASAQCQGNLALVNETLREENAWLGWYGSNSDRHAENLRDKTIADVAQDINAARAKSNYPPQQ